MACRSQTRILRSGTRKTSLSPTPRAGISSKVSANTPPRASGTMRYVSAMCDLDCWDVTDRQVFLVVEPERRLCRLLPVLEFRREGQPVLRPAHQIAAPSMFAKPPSLHSVLTPTKGRFSSVQGLFLHQQQLPSYALVLLYVIFSPIFVFSWFFPSVC